MIDLSALSKLPDVRSAVLGDLSGTFLDAYAEHDGEAVAAMMGFAAAALADVGQQLGIGALQRASVAGDARACVVAVAGEFVITAAPTQAAALATVEKAVDAAVHGKV